MTYAPPPYQQPGYSLDPTNVMGRRVVAHIIDLILVGVVVAILFVATARKIDNVPAGYCTNTTNGHPSGCVEVGNTAYVLDGGRTSTTLLIVGGYWTIVGMIEGATGAFLGKRMLGLRVVDSNGQVAGAGRGAGRGVMMLVDSTFCFLIGLITAVATHPHRRLGDMAAGTFVVAKESVGRPVVTVSGTYVPYASPPMAAPGAFAPGTYGTSQPPFAQQQPPADVSDVSRWGAPTIPTGQAPPANGGWTPTPAPQADPAPPPPMPAPQPAPPQPQWDAARNAWIVWDPARAQWLEWNATTSQWGPISQ